MKLFNRLHQGLRALLAFAIPIDDALAQTYLPPAYFALFKCMTRSEQLHSLRVLRSVLEQAPNTPAVLAIGALMHDVGKSRYAQNTAQRTMAVLIQQFFPALERRFIATQALTWWSAPSVVRRYHPQWSGELLQQLGADPCVVWLVTHHADGINRWHGHEWVELLQRLQIADNQN